MATYACPKGHESTESDFCSECGAKIQGVPAAPAPPVISGGPAAAASGQACPDCQAPREGGGDFCEVCGYNFKTGAHGEMPVNHPSPAPSAVQTPLPAQESTPVPAPPPTPPVAPAAADVVAGWDLSVTVDPTLRGEGSPEAPRDFAPVAIRLKPGSSLIGRTSERRGVHPEVPMDHDDAVSHRHALFDFRRDGSLFIRDVGSSNGTRINGVEVKPLEDIALKDGDKIELGHWTRITVQAVRQKAA